MTTPDPLLSRQALRLLQALQQKQAEIEQKLNAPRSIPGAPGNLAAPITAQASLTPAEEDQGYAEAERLIAASQADEAIEQLRNLANRGAIRWDIYNDLGALLLNEGAHAEAFHALKTAANLEFSSTHALRNLIVAYVQQGEIANALAATGLLLKKEPHDPDILNFIQDLLVESSPRLDDYAWLSGSLAATLEEHEQTQQRLAHETPRHQANQYKAELYEWLAQTRLPAANGPEQTPGNGSFWTPPANIGHRDQPSCIVFLPPTCGGASVYRVLDRISRDHYRYLNFEVDALVSNAPYKGELSAMYGYAYQLTGNIYSWRDSTRLTDSLKNSSLLPEDFRHLIILRDPRDSLVSLYHILRDPVHLPPKELNAFQSAAETEKERLESLSLDDYVLETAPSWSHNITGLARMLKDVPPEKIEFLSYVELCENFPLFMQRLTAFLQITPAQPVLQQLLLTEDVKRKDTLVSYSLARLTHAAPMPGRHKRELQPATIAELNRITAEARSWMASLEIPEYRHLYND